MISLYDAMVTGIKTKTKQNEKVKTMITISIEYPSVILFDPSIFLDDTNDEIDEFITGQQSTNTKHTNTYATNTFKRIPKLYTIWTVAEKWLIIRLKTHQLENF